MSAKLTQALVTRYAKLSALKNLIDTWLESKRSLILEALGGQSCPNKGPYLLLSKEVKCGPNYKELFILYLQSSRDMTALKATEYVEEQAKKIEWGTAVRLEKKINPDYRKTFTVKLPA